MNLSRNWGALVLVATLAASAEQPPAETMTWQEANKRSAELVKKRQEMERAVDLARLAFDLYPQQTREYRAENHAQLLMNLVDTQWKAAGAKAALVDLDRGLAAVIQRTGPKDPVLIDLWRQGAAVSTRRDARYYAEAMTVAEAAWGPEDRRTLKLGVSMTHDLRANRGYDWAKSQFRSLRERAAKAGQDSIVAQCDLLLAKLEMEKGDQRDAIEGFSALVERLEKQTDRDQEQTLVIAYGMLEALYEERGNANAAADIRERRTLWIEQHPETMTGTSTVPPGALLPLSRVAPQYPREALKRGLEGVVEFQVDVNPDGTVAGLKVLKSEPAGVFDEAASRALRKWKFKPKIVDGEPVPSSGWQRVEFSLSPGD